MKLKNSFDHVKLYEDKALQEQARTCIPLEELQREARRELASLTESKIADNQPKLHEEDFVLLGLLNWFKTSFFQWVDAPNCENCGDKTVNVGMVEPLPEEIRWGGNRVENYKCSNCSAFTRFPRYNHPGKLLETQRGRCGEWANCFTLCCRSLGMESRYVLDWTDHVWTEVYSMSQRRWLHCDPCENVCDKPLLYSSGWGKKLTYVIAFSKEDIQDVTWRYTTNHAEVLRRRTECRETYLINTIFQMRRSRQAGLSEVRRKVLAERLVMELADFMTAKSTDDQELPGRTTGSLSWREQRGEVGSKRTATFEAYSFKPVLREIESRCMHVKYCCVSDKYIRVSDAEAETKGWDSCVHEVGVLHRKEERDWNMVYLARNPGQNEDSSITWKFDLTGENENNYITL